MPQIPIDKLKSGDIIAFKGGGTVFRFLSFLLGIFEPKWGRRNWKPWHLAIAWEEVDLGWYILEATGLGVKINYYSSKHLSETSRCYSWLSKVPNEKQMTQFLQSHIDKSYDVAIYFWTSLAIIVRHFFNHPIPKLLDNRFDCWELVAEFCENMGKPITSKYDTIIITDVIKSLETNKP